ncbi:ATP-binding protein [Brevibacillus sp. NRS-1366]|uniref:ATP-binding protein n=1 Tax=Brevibacillus sp. NRS-1366 TaxID=3233899 RepID=UPI003D24187C
MRIDEIQLKGFGKWQNASFRFAPGINVLEAPNEAGKSTLLQGIFAALYGMKRDYVKSARYLPEYEKYRPWHLGDYETIITYQLAGKAYRLHRCLNKEREQARIFLDPEWAELTDIYFEDRRKERPFIEKHLGLTRSLFTDITWIRREPLSAAEHLMPSLTSTEEANPAVMKILAELDRDLTSIGKKERAENTLLGKAAALAAGKEQELANAEAAWKVISGRAQQIAEWEAERTEQEQLRSRLLQRRERWNEQEQMWQERWQKSYKPLAGQKWEWWEQTASSQEERLVHREAQSALSDLLTSTLDVEETLLPIGGEGDLDRLQIDYERGMRLRKRWEECHLELASMATAAISGSRRQDRSYKEGNLKKQRRGKALLWGTAGVFLLLAMIAFLAGHSVMGGIALGVAILFSVTSLTIYRGKENEQRSAMASGSVPQAHWQQLQEEVGRLDEELLQLVHRWETADWDAFLKKREVQQNSARSQESKQLTAEVNRKEQEVQLTTRWGESLRMCLEQEKAIRGRERVSWQKELLQTEERLQELREQIARANGQIGAHETVSVAKARGDHEEAVAGLRQLQMKRDALQLARDTLQEALAEWNRDVSPAVNQQASEAFAHITGGAYLDVRLDPREGFAVRLLEPSKQLVLEQEQCSTGTQDQLYFAQRLALLHHVSKQTEPLPLFFDDHFVHYDQERLRRALEYVVMLSEEQQIFLFTCQDRELRLLEPLIGKSGRHRVHQLGEMCE